MLFITKYFQKKRIKNKLMELISKNIDLQKKGLTTANQITKSDFDSVELMLLFQKIEAEFGKQSLIEFYKVQTLDDIVEMIYHKKT